MNEVNNVMVHNLSVHNSIIYSCAINTLDLLVSFFYDIFLELKGLSPSPLHCQRLSSMMALLVEIP
jgi:hypothetical protein